MAYRHWEARQETYFKMDILFKIEDVFVEEDFSLQIPQTVVMSTEKCWRSTTNLLKEIAQFAIVGKVGGWCVDNGALIEECTIEPTSEKTAVASYLYARDLVKKGKREMYDEATDSLGRAIAKYERHALAYERRGYINYKLKNYNDALYDFDRSISINANNAEPYYGRGKVYMIKNDWESAATNFDATIKRSLALEPVYWLARLRKGECLFHSKRFEEAVKEFRLFLKRSFTQDNPNFQRRRRALMLLGKSLVELDQIDEAIEVINQALAIKDGAEYAPEADGLVTRAKAKRKSGTAEFTADLMSAAEMGSDEANRLLAEWKTA